MKQLCVSLFGVSAVSLAAIFAAFSWQDAKPASACSGPPTHQQIALADVVIEGRVVSALERPSAGDSLFRVFDLEIEVTIGLRGVTSGTRLMAQASVPNGSQPVMCPQWDRDETFLGKWVVGALFSGDGGLPGLGRWGTAYLGLDPGSAEYSDAARVARIAIGGGPNLPALHVTLADERCETLVNVTGSRFEPGQKVLLNYPAQPNASGFFAHPTAVADSSGRFTHGFRLPADWCPLDAFVEAFGWREDNQIGGWPLAMAPLTASGTPAPLPPDAGTGPTRGADSLLWLRLGSLVLLASVILLRGSRRRR